MFPERVHYQHLIHGPNRVSATIVSRFPQIRPNRPFLPPSLQAASGPNFCQAASFRAAQPHSVPRRTNSSSSSASR